ncbi:MAG: septum formation initiator family protein [Eubacterium sp.]|nr:septum formation initiator family protein [Eubacterium sp.]MBR2278959.1 septum formation initiator family protein [Eubacterium sp.]
MAQIKQRLATKNWGKILTISIIVIVLVFSTISLIRNQADISRLKAQAAECDAQYAQQVEENEKIKAILNTDNKDDYIEQKAREKGYVKDNEVVFYDISE